jgi:poly(3-hydroxybutyrate) depolymerase
VRATAPIAGDNYADPSRCTAEAPSFMSVTGTEDYNVSQDRAQAALAYWEGRLGCGGSMSQVAGLPQCDEDQSCPAGTRVRGCWRYDEGHWVPNQWQPVPVAQAIWEFFDSFQ